MDYRSILKVELLEFAGGLDVKVIGKVESKMNQIFWLESLEEYNYHLLKGGQVKKQQIFGSFKSVSDTFVFCCLYKCSVFEGWK